MTHTEALKLALEALGKFSIGYHVDAVELNDLIATLEAALEQEQEPVAWRTFDGEGGYDYRTYDDNENYRDEWDKRNPNHKGWVQPLYTHPPRREWRGLTVEFIREATDDNGLDWHNGWTVGDDSVNRYLNLARAIEAALKERNA
jgi:hypothetical protein